MKEINLSDDAPIEMTYPFFDIHNDIEVWGPASFFVVCVTETRSSQYICFSVDEQYRRPYDDRPIKGCTFYEHGETIIKALELL